jgi:hypothetical protein
MQKITNTIKTIGKMVLFFVDPVSVAREMNANGANLVQLKTY